ncbi:class I adenylate-forming enzyme family protein [Pseudomonas sp. NFX224]|uniref:class I adenylate-forming enzyme family protein n=1 Tax=Pseudomonas sp. NFX224 TaxID=3402862 RepID=UPI003AFAB08C
MSIDLLQRLEAVFSLDPNAVAIEQDGREYTYGQVASLVSALDRTLEQAEIPAGTPVGLLLRNRPGCLAVALGLIWKNRCLVTVNPMLPPEPLRRDLEALNVPVLVAEAVDWEDPVFSTSARQSKALGLKIVYNPDGFALEIVQHAGFDDTSRDRLPDIAIEMLTSGTTGAPKRIKLRRESLSKSLWAGARYESGGGELSLHKTPALLWMPLVHIGGLWNAIYQWYNGRRILLIEKFSLDAWHHAVSEHRLRFASLPPSALGDLLERNWPREDFSSLLAIRCGAAPLNHDLAEQFEDRYGVPVLEAYGATEFAGGVAGWTIKDYRAFGRAKRRSVGRANPGVKLRVVDAQTFEPVAANQEGLLEVCSPQSEDATAWVRTTDRAKLDEDGFLYILGRADNAINRGGFKIMPEHVESVLRDHPAVVEACVVGVVDERLGQIPVAACQQRSGVPAPEYTELKAWLSVRLKSYEIPVHVRWMPELPRTPSLKVSQLSIRELFRTP